MINYLLQLLQSKSAEELEDLYWEKFGVITHSLLNSPDGRYRITIWLGELLSGKKCSTGIAGLFYLTIVDLQERGILSEDGANKLHMFITSGQSISEMILLHQILSEKVKELETTTR